MGRFIVFEGSDGIGKSTQLRLLGEALRERGYDVVVTREPGGTPLAEEIRETLIKKREEAVHPDTELMLSFAARRQHLFERIVPALEDNKVVLCDRFIPSAYAYQVCGHGASQRLFNEFSNLCLNEVRDSIHYLAFELDGAEASNRVDDRGNKDRMEMESDDFFGRVQSGYSEYFGRVVKNAPHTIDMVDASGSIDEVFERVLGKALHALESDRRFNHPSVNRESTVQL